MPPANQPNPESKGSNSIESVDAANLPTPSEAATPPTRDDGSSTTQTPAPVSLPKVPTPTQPAAKSPKPINLTGPQIADDVDVIEKDWVDKAEKIIDQTKTDPYAEEEAVEALQMDYLKKRYGHDVKKPDNQT